jgi:integrase
VDCRACSSVTALLHKNPVDALDNPRGALGRLIGSTETTKPHLDLDNVERAAAVLGSGDRAYFDFLRFTGLRKDEANRLRWDDISFNTGSFHCRGTKTGESDAWLPLAPPLIESSRNTKRRVSRIMCFPVDLIRPVAKRFIHAVSSLKRSSG